MNLRRLLAKASPARSGDELAGLGAVSAEERVRALDLGVDTKARNRLATVRARAVTGYRSVL
jgi:ethanolamine ammonia-lyase large subunit